MLAVVAEDPQQLKVRRHSVVFAEEAMDEVCGELH